MRNGQVKRRTEVRRYLSDGGAMGLGTTEMMRSFFRHAQGTDAEPFPYQCRLAEGGWPEVMVIPY